MKLLVQSAMIFFGTLMAAGLVALGEPAEAKSELTAVAKAAQLAPASPTYSAESPSALRLASGTVATATR